MAVTDWQFRRWRRPDPPRPRPRPRAWQVLDALFGVSPLDAGFPGPEPSVTVKTSPSHTEGVPMDRRAFVTDSLGVAAGLALGSSDAVETAHIVALREGLHFLYTLDDAHGGGDVRSLAVRHLTRVRRVVNTSTCPETIGRQLQLLAGGPPSTAHGSTTTQANRTPRAATGARH
ncbi:hypothetical protein [Streptomyces sp. Root1310]|uniref:hypothetical protein n=1 Tax=Streptomyces sp. Root1310 TaxID=1736452 RepID=UPI000ADD5C6E|nr:hypothetical protein [Streptomyces sp. Root1310]